MIAMTLKLRHISSCCTGRQFRWLFSVPPPSTFFEENLQKNVQTDLVQSEILFHNRRLASIKTVFCLNKTFFTHMNCGYVRIHCFL